MPAIGLSACASARRNRASGASPVVPCTRTSATSRVQASRCASKASQLGKELVKHDRARDRIMLDHQCPGVVEQDLLGHPAKFRERTFQSVEPALLPFVAECPDVMPARIAERGNEQIRANLAPADLDQALAKIDLELLARRRLKPHRCPRLRRKLLPIRLHRPLHRAQADDDSLLGGQLLADHVGIAAMTAQALPQPGLLPVERLLALRLPVRSPAASAAM
jgi:hypothetical protein